MGGFSINLLFTRNNCHEPGALISNNTSGEYLPYHFYDWRDAVHYINWSQNLKNDNFDEWCDKYGYSENESFEGNLNEFRSYSTENNNEWTIFVNDDIIQFVNENTDLNKISVWNNIIDCNLES
jgi:hypothetical protein